MLFDECGCDDTQCAPNRILESFDLDVRIDPPERVVHHGSAKLAWKDWLKYAHAGLVAADPASGRLYVATVADPGTLHQLNLDNHVHIASATLEGRATGLAVLSDGSVAVAMAGAAAADPARLAIFAPNGGSIAPARRTARVPWRGAKAASFASTP